MRVFGSTVATVVDKPTWELARGNIQRIEQRAGAIAAELKGLPVPTPEEVQASRQVMKGNEDALEKALGDKESFIQALPAEVGRELMEAAGNFSRKMGETQQALYGKAG